MKVLIPVRYPLTEPNKRAIRRGMELIQGIDDSELLIFYLNEVQSKRRLNRQSLREVVEAEFEEIEANYLVRDGFLIEEAIIEVAIELEMDYILLSQQRQARWKRLLSEILDLDQDPEQLIQDYTGISIEVIPESDTEFTNT